MLILLYFLLEYNTYKYYITTLLGKCLDDMKELINYDFPYCNQLSNTLVWGYYMYEALCCTNIYIPNREDVSHRHSIYLYIMFHFAIKYNKCGHKRSNYSYYVSITSTPWRQRNVAMVQEHGRNWSREGDIRFLPLHTTWSYTHSGTLLWPWWTHEQASEVY